MPSFTDNTGYEWPFEIDFPTLNRVHKLLHVDVVSMSESQLLDRFSSPIFFINLLYVICKPEADKLGLSDEEFGRRCVMRLEPVINAVLGGIADFFQLLGMTRQSQLLVRSMMLAKEMESLPNDQIGSVLEKMDESLRVLIQESISGEPSGVQQPEPELAI